MVDGFIISVWSCSSLNLKTFFYRHCVVLWTTKMGNNGKYLIWNLKTRETQSISVLFRFSSPLTFHWWVFLYIWNYNNQTKAIIRIYTNVTKIHRIQHKITISSWSTHKTKKNIVKFWQSIEPSCILLLLLWLLFLRYIFLLSCIHPPIRYNTLLTDYVCFVGWIGYLNSSLIPFVSFWFHRAREFPLAVPIILFIYKFISKNQAHIISYTLYIQYTEYFCFSTLISVVLFSSLCE